MYKYSYPCKYISGIRTNISVSIHVLYLHVYTKIIFKIYQERLFSSLKIMHVLKNVSLKTPRLCNFTQISTL